MVAGVGIDIIEIGRMERVLARRPRLGERLFTDEERRYAAGRARPGAHLAARFAAKEAVAKALALRGFAFRDIEVVAGPPPAIRLGGAAAERAERLGVEVAVSLTHARENAAAIAVAVAGRLPGGR